jgi:hypothetical protein
MYEPYREPLISTLTRTGVIALIVGGLLAWQFGGLTAWPAETSLALWPSLGGHFVELWFLNVVRPHLPDDRAIRSAARVGVWFLGGAVLTLGMRGTAVFTGIHFPSWITWWLGGLGFIGIELVAHLASRFRGLRGKDVVRSASDG